MSAPVPSSKPAIDIAKLRYILATDCGSTTTKAILVEKVGSSWRQTQRAEAPTTVEEPFANVTIGVSNALTEIGELAGRRFIADDGTIYLASEAPQVFVLIPAPGAAAFGALTLGSLAARRRR